MAITRDTVGTGRDFERIVIRYNVGDAKGNNANPFNLDDIVAVSDSENWDIPFYKIGNTYFSDYEIYITGVNTYFKIDKKRLIWSNTNIAGQYNLYGRGANCQFTNSEFVNERSDTTRFNIDLATNNIFDNNTVKGFFYAGIQTNTTNCVFQDILYPYILGYEYKNNLYKNIIYGLWLCGSPTKFENNIARDCTTALFLDMYLISDVGATLKDLAIERGTYGLYLRLADRSQPEATFELENINVDLTKKIITRVSTATMNIKINQRLSVISDAGTAKLYDKDDNLVEQITLNGTTNFTPVTCLHNVIESEGTTIVRDEIINHQPFKIIVEREGYETQPFTNLYFTENDHKGSRDNAIIRIDWKKQIDVMASNKGVVIKANPKNYGKNRDFVIIP